MSNAVIRYRAILSRASMENKTGLPNNVWAMLMLYDESKELDYYDRNRYDERLKLLESAKHRYDTRGDCE